MLMNGATARVGISRLSEGAEHLIEVAGGMLS